MEFELKNNEAYFIPGVVMGPSKIVSQVGPAIWPAITNIYIRSSCLASY